MAKVEIGENKFYVPKALSINEGLGANGNSASLTVEVALNDISHLLNRVPILVCINGEDGINVFNGQIKQLPTAFIDNGQTRSYSLSVLDFYDYAHRDLIPFYSTPNTFEQHVINLLSLSGADGAPGSNLRLLAYTIIGALPDQVSGTFRFTFGPGYLDDALTRLCGLAKMAWDITHEPWTRIESLTSGAIARIRFTTVDPLQEIEEEYGPREEIRIPPNCQDVWYESLSVTITAPQCSEVLVLGQNAMNAPLDLANPGQYLTSVQTVETVNVAANTTQLGYNYLATAGEISIIELIPKI